MSSHILHLPFRKTHTVALADALKQYISSKYDQHPDMFKDDLDTIDRLRGDAVSVREPHISGVKIITAYAAQLVWMSGKFPIDIGVEFTWYPSIGYNTDRPTTQDNLKFELSNVLFNLAALYSQLAVSTNRTTGDGLKQSNNYFCLAAGVLNHLKTVVVPEMRSTPAEDMDTNTLESLEQLMLAQAQECFWRKAVVDGYKDASIAKLAARVSDLYSNAGDWGIKSSAVSSEWIHHTTAKHHHFAAAAQYRQACDCLEKRKYGEEVARLRDSLACVNEALKESRYINKTILADLNGLKDKVQEDLKRADKDNDVIYLNPVPPKSELKILDRANMAVAKVPPAVADPIGHLDKGDGLGRPLFQQLVPFAVHVAASIYEQRRDRLISTRIIDELETLTTSIHETLQSLNLPGSLQALEKPMGLPPTLLSHAEEIRQADALSRLQKSFSDSAKLKSSDEAILTEGKQLLVAEASEDEQLRLKYGTERWTRPNSQAAAAQLYSQLTEIDGYLKSAASSDALVRDKFTDCQDMLQVLSGTDRDLASFVPSSRHVTIPPALQTEVTKLRSCLSDVNRLESRRRRKIEAIREKGKQDDISSTILSEAGRLEREYPNTPVVAAHFEDFFEKRLTRYDADIDSMKGEAAEQDQLVARLQHANAAFVAARSGDNTSVKVREQALQKLENAYYKYKEIVNNLDVGRKFYNDLGKLVTRFRDDCRQFVYSRRAEAAQLESDLNLPPLSNLSLQHQRDHALPAQPHPHAHRPGDPPMPAPVPTRASVVPPAVQAPPMPQVALWSPESGINFGGPAAGAPAPHADANVQPGSWNPTSEIRFG